MAHSLSAKKRVRQDAKKKLINRARKSAVKTQVKHLEDAIKAGDLAKVQEAFKATSKKLDKVASTSTMHKNTAARKKSRLAKRVNALKAKSSAQA
ncbi:MAG: 30S ribosomal protein S20 [Planctomycetes bacterium GWF2_50_10]|nr:MAG: 30S ribosomal protein S20 [Planctomycetes bacterium GWF2_50_10]